MGLRGLSLSQPEFPEKPEKSGKTITFKNYHFNYEKEEVLHMSDVTVPAESIIAVTGHNGAGKSTFLRCLCGLEKKFKGHTVLDGANLSGRQMLKNCYMVMQDVNHQLFCETVEEEIQLGMAEEKADKVSDLLRELDLAGFRERHPMSLSGGQKQRVAIASAVLAEKSVLIFDEPTSGLDYKHMRQTAGLFQRLKERKKTMFIITHDPELIAMCCTHVLHIEHGEVQEFYPLTREHCGQFMEQFSFS